MCNDKNWSDKLQFFTSHNVHYINVRRIKHYINLTSNFYNDSTDGSSPDFLRLISYPRFGLINKYF